MLIEPRLDNYFSFVSTNILTCRSADCFYCRKVKHSQIVSGVKWYNFWLSTFSWDFINFMIPSLAIAILFAAADIKQFAGNNIGVVLSVL